MAAPNLASAPGWPALLLAPLLAISHVSLAYALVSPSCARQDTVTLHVVAAASLLIALALTVHAWRHWSAATATLDRGTGVTWSDSGDPAARPGFVSLMATLAGALSSLVIVAAWVPTWLLPPCS